MSNVVRLAVLSMLACALLFSPPARAGRAWMSEDAMRGAFGGKTLDGYYLNGQDWTETYASDGHLDYRDAKVRSSGKWYVRGGLFCTFYDRETITGGCFNTVQVSANCYEFYSAGIGEDEGDREGEAD